MSAPFKVSDASRWTDGELLRGDPATILDRVTSDSRTAGPGCLFIAIVGPNHDAHRFLPQVAKSGASAVMIERGRPLDPSWEGALPVLTTTNTTQALGALAAGHRARFEGTVIAITGSSGKTTTKEMCASILQRVAPCLKTEGNLNNQFGLPLTLLRREADHASAVIELGMNHRGEIATLAAIARPDVGLITNVGTAHIEYLGSEAEIAREKGDLYAALPPTGIACANFDDPRVVEQAKRAPCPVLGYGCEQEASVRARNVRFLPEGRFAFEIETPEVTREVEVRGLSTTTVINALAATTVALAVGRSLDDVAAFLVTLGVPSRTTAP